ncbi:WG repeat-containing protein [Parabacteroides pacaensis]|uniref:WG repeat-containing protein n=1 Tax=Parabacteroides pacaensis TaxID=2086575 RepID=UPI000D112615|nr:WG repeat-containing protein [Parabacteroides pacaensis]
MKKLILILLLSFSLFHVMAQSMEWLCHPGKFTEIRYLGHDLFKVKGGKGLWGIISAEGKEVLEVKYDSITSYVENRSLILDKTGKKIQCIIDQNGEIIKSFIDEQIYTTAYPCYKEGLLSYKDKKGLCGYLNIQGDVAIKARFYLAAPFQNGVATVQYADGDGYFGLINKSGGSAIISDIKYKFLSSLVDGHLFAVTSSSRGGDLLRIMKLEGNQLVGMNKLASKMFVDLSDDFTYLLSQNGHHYFIDNQWRISGANYNLKLPYTIKDNFQFITESSELLSKQETQEGIQITYMGKPILEHSFDNVETYEKRYAIVSAKNKKVGVLKLNPSAGIELIAPTQVIVFYHNPLPVELSANLDEIEPQQYVEVQVDIKDVNPLQLKCYINEEGYLRYAPLKLHNGIWKLHLPYFHADTKYDNVVSKETDIAITYDGLDWMHRLITLSSKHEQGYKIHVSGSNTTDEAGKAIINIEVQSINSNSNSTALVEISGQKPISFKGNSTIIPISVSIPQEGESKTFIYTITISEKGCPTMKQEISRTITYPKKDKQKKEIIII